jgi:hypothetical protein
MHCDRFAVGLFLVLLLCGLESGRAFGQQTAIIDSFKEHFGYGDFGGDIEGRLRQDASRFYLYWAAKDPFRSSGGSETEITNGSGCVEMHMVPGSPTLKTKYWQTRICWSGITCVNGTFQFSWSAATFRGFLGSGEEMVATHISSGKWFLTNPVVPCGAPASIGEWAARSKFAKLLTMTKGKIDPQAFDLKGPYTSVLKLYPKFYPSKP